MTAQRSRRQVTGEEARLWRHAMRGTRPLPGRPPLPEDEAEDPPPPAAAPDLPPPPPLPPPAALPRARSVAQPELWHDHSPGLDRRTAQRMRRGELSVEGVIDLHGMTQQAAYAALWRFIQSSAGTGRRLVLVVTGKGTREGTGVLRHQVPHWLNQAGLRDRILAFTHAHPKDGGTGALYVLLRRQRG